MNKLLGLVLSLLIIGGYAFADDLANVSLDYCTTAENLLQYQIDPGAETGICYTLSNGSTAPVTIKLSFIDGVFTNDQRQNKACLSDADKENFGKYVTGYDEFVTLKAGETIKKNAQMSYPAGMDGLYHGCVVYSVVTKTKNKDTNNNSFSILMRRAKFIDVIVGDPENAKDKGIILEEFTATDGDNLSHNKKIRIYKDLSDNMYVLQLKIKNISPVEQDVVITGVASNILTYKNTFVESRKILKGESLVITKKLETLPAYNITTKFTISNTPFTFGGQDPKVGTTKEKTTILIWNVVTYLTLLGILLFAGMAFLLIKDLKKKQKKQKTQKKVKK